MSKYDLGQSSIIHMIRQAYIMFDIGAIGALRAVGRDIGSAATLEMEDLEGSAEEVQPGVMALPVCPFAGSIETFKNCCGDLPKELSTLAEFANNQGEAWVSAFCGIHQSLRSEKIGDSYQQIGCRSGDKVILAEQDVMSKDEAAEILKIYACLYAR